MKPRYQGHGHCQGATAGRRNGAERCLRGVPAETRRLQRHLGFFFPKQNRKSPINGLVYGLRENWNRKPPYFMVKTMVSGVDFPLNPSIDPRFHSHAYSQNPNITRNPNITGLVWPRVNKWLKFIQVIYSNCHGQLLPRAKCGAMVTHPFPNVNPYGLMTIPAMHACTSFALKLLFTMAHSGIPSGKLTVCYWKWPFIVDLSFKMVIFHSYVSLPEGIVHVVYYILLPQSQHNHSWMRSQSGVDHGIPEGWSSLSSLKLPKFTRWVHPKWAFGDNPQ